MRTLLTLSVLLFLGCSDSTTQESPHQCVNQSREFWAATPFPWDTYDTTEVTKMTNGCDLTTVTHYVYVQDDGSGSGGDGGNIFERQCQYAECDGPLNKIDYVSDPMDVRVYVNSNGERVLILSDGSQLVPVQH